MSARLGHFQGLLGMEAEAAACQLKARELRYVLQGTESDHHA